MARGEAGPNGWLGRGVYALSPGKREALNSGDASRGARLQWRGSVARRVGRVLAVASQWCPRGSMERVLMSSTSPAIYRAKSEVWTRTSPRNGVHRSAVLGAPESAYEPLAALRMFGDQQLLPPSPVHSRQGSKCWVEPRFQTSRASSSRLRIFNAPSPSSHSF